MSDGPGVTLFQQRPDARPNQLSHLVTIPPRRRSAAAAFHVVAVVRAVALGPDVVADGVVVVVEEEQSAEQVEGERVGVVTEVSAADPQRPGQQLDVGTDQVLDALLLGHPTGIGYETWTHIGRCLT